MQSGLRAVAVLALAIGLLPASAIAGPSSLAATNVGPFGIEWQPSIAYEKLVVTVSGPEGLILRREFAAGGSAVFEAMGADGKPLPDGDYTYELVASPVLDRATRRALAAARRNGDDSVVAKLRAEGKLPSTPLVQSGSFKVAGGSIVQQDAREERNGGATQTKAAPRPVTAADQVIPDDLIVQGSACVGLDCVNNENFGFDTIRLKENNLRIHFDDTSNQVGFPANDWRLIANDSASGGSSKFSIEDSTGARTPFTITAGATTNSIFVDSTGRVGLRTSTPVLDLHINTSNTPAIRLEQNNSGGFTAQTWDIGANEANFFVRDVTGGSLLSFRIRPGAPTSSVDISSDGDVGIGTGSPSSKLHVLGSDGSNKLTVEETNGTASAREILELKNNGAVAFIFDDTSRASRWSFANIQGTDNIVFDEQASAGVEMTLTNAGNMTIEGTLTQGSSRDVKTNFESVDPRTVLTRVAELPVSVWTYKEDTARHFGPMAEDFYQAFGLGANNKGIAPGDTAGIALAAVQGLNQVVQEKDKQITQLSQTIDELQQQNSALEARLAAIERMLNSQND